MSNYHTFQSGEEYTLGQLLGARHCLVVPDLQRDYCWGSETYGRNRERQGELVTAFVDDLIEAFRADEARTLGVLYGYEEVAGRVMLCDGQQRFTTLYLLVGVLTHRIDGVKFASYLQGFPGDVRLSYEVRESTLSFLGDLSRYYFCDRSGVLPPAEGEDKAQTPDWYGRAYRLDLSARSMLAAVRTIEALLDAAEVDEEDFGRYVLDELRFVYYDMGDRQHGEEAFVVINTTGEPLTATENLKPQLLSRVAGDARSVRAHEWEDREDWCWRHRDREGGERTSDALSRDFYVWFWQMRRRQGSETLRRERLDALFLKADGELDEMLAEVHRCFTALKTVVGEVERGGALHDLLATLRRLLCEGEGTDGLFTWLRRRQAEDVLFPLVAFAERFGAQASFATDVVRLARRLCKNAADKKFGRPRPDGGGYVDWRYVLQLVDCAEDVDGLLTADTLGGEAALKSISNVHLARWFDADEQDKRRLAASGADVAVWEEDDALRFDLSVLGGSTATVDDARRRRDNLAALSLCRHGGDAPADLAAFYWLYRFLKGWGDGVGHVGYATWDGEGTYYHTYDYGTDYGRAYRDADFLSLLASADLLAELKHRVADAFRPTGYELTAATFTPTAYLRSWLLLKTLVAADRGVVLNYWDDRAIGCYAGQADDNRLNDDQPFCMANSCAGYLFRSDVRRAEDYLNPSLFDAPLLAPGCDVDGEAFENRKVPVEVVRASADYLARLYEAFMAGA